jgi:hypothetical protein
VRTRHRIEGLIALGLAAATSSAGLAVSARNPRPTAVTLCLPDETILFSGRFARALGSVCLSAERVHYRYGPPGHSAIDIVSADDWSNVHYGRITGGGGGYQRHVRFTVGNRNYVIFEGEYGNLTAFPGRRWSGIYVGREDLTGATIWGRPHPRIAAGWTDMLVGRAPLARRSDSSLEETQGGPWDAWF